MSAEDLKGLKIGVVAGGCSSEREISLKSGNAVFRALKGAGYDAELIELVKEDSSFLGKARPDVLFIALHGRFGEDGRIQEMLEKEGIPYTGSGPGPSMSALDKVCAKQRFVACGISTPDHKVVSAGDTVDWDDIETPCVLKPQFEGSSIGLSIVRDRTGLAEAFKKAAGFGGKVLVERYIDGRELTVGVLDGATLPVVEIITPGGHYDFNAKYSSSETVYEVPARIDGHTERAARQAGLAAHLALGCRGFSRVDMRLDSRGEVFVLEVNTIPGFTERSLLPMAARAAGIGFADLCVKILALSLRDRNKL